MATELFDIDYYGRLKPDGTPYTELGDGAISTAIVRFLASSKGDYLYSPDFGGVLDQFLFKAMTPETSENISLRLSSELNRVFEGFAGGFIVTAIPDFDQRQWSILITYSSLLTGKSGELEVFAESEGGQEVRPFVNIPEIGEVLYNIILTLKGYKENEGSKLIFNTEIEKWTYGKYIFENLTIEDEFFASILSFLNS